jgi:chemotaxis protein MotB
MIIEEETTPSVPEWFVTFADMMTLLLAFFVMLVSISNFQEPKQFQSLVAMLQEQFGHNRAHGEVEKNLVIAASADDIPDAEQRRGTLPGGILYFGQLAIELTEEHRRSLHQIARARRRLKFVGMRRRLRSIPTAEFVITGIWPTGAATAR